MSLLDSFLNSIFMYAAQKEVDKDPEFQKKMKQYNDDVKRLSKEIQDIIDSYSKKKNNG